MAKQEKINPSKVKTTEEKKEKPKRRLISEVIAEGFSEEKAREDVEKIRSEVKRFNPLNTCPRKITRGHNFSYVRKIGLDPLVIRYLYAYHNFEYSELGKILNMPEDDVYQFYIGFRKRLSPEELFRISVFTETDIETIKLYAKKWTSKMSDLDMPIKVKIVNDNDNFLWFSKGDLLKRFTDTNQYFLFKIDDMYLSSYGFSKGDLVLASKLKNDLAFKEKSVFLIKGPDGCVYPRIAQNKMSITQEGYASFLMDPTNANNIIPYNDLPKGIELLGKIVWKCGEI